LLIESIEPHFNTRVHLEHGYVNIHTKKKTTTTTSIIFLVRPGFDLYQSSRINLIFTRFNLKIILNKSQVMELRVDLHGLVR
jgi:hypothetical protein